VVLPIEPERKSSLIVDATLPDGIASTGAGVWRFTARRDLVPVPAGVTTEQLIEAHGTIIVDAATQKAYWGLRAVGWIEFDQSLRLSRVIDGDVRFKAGNLHGADVLPRSGQPSLVMVADDESSQVLVTDTTFSTSATRAFKAPSGVQFPQYRGEELFFPTDVAIKSATEAWVTDGYGEAWFFPLDLQNLRIAGRLHGGKTFSDTPHGITLDPESGNLLVAARPEGQVKRWQTDQQKVTKTLHFPIGTTVCDVAIWGDYALAPTLDGPGGTPGVIYVVNLKTHKIVAELKPKDLGFAAARHIHDAAWYVTGSDDAREVYVLFTTYDPGSIGVMQLISEPADLEDDAEEQQ
jgi:hypothetical protein